jgi:hypothetical protein
MVHQTGARLVDHKKPWTSLIADVDLDSRYGSKRPQSGHSG